jgi:hypothetical protein
MAYEYEAEEWRCAVAQLTELQRAEHEPPTLAELTQEDAE